mmetsp:Transcript_13682/g.32518  ORF Transcript_13682/g.32518 Transcript_13682/m.32518 type:complete len:98 (-) Transcript_13682:228-521(-)
MRSAPVVIKLNVEGAEYGGLSSILLSGALCGVDAIMHDLHPAPAGFENVPADWMQGLHYSIAHTPQCKTRLAELDDESFFRIGEKGRGMQCSPRLSE